MTWVEKIIREEPYGIGNELMHSHYTGEEIVRCRDCEGFNENATPHDGTMPHFCSVLGIDLEDGDGFCKWARKRVTIS